jgi:5,10-methylenetetrahydrofolate reductase
LNLIKELGGIPLAHCTFANQEFGEVEKYIDSLSANEIKKILVLRGDLPNGKEKFKFASEFMEYIKNNRTDFEIFGA